MYNRNAYKSFFMNGSLKEWTYSEDTFLTCQLYSFDEKDAAVQIFFNINLSLYYKPFKFYKQTYLPPFIFKFR